MALRFNRTFVDYSPSFLGLHNPNSKEYTFSMGWKYGDFLDLSRLSYEMQVREEKFRCRVKILRKMPTRLKPNSSILTIEYGRPPSSCTPTRNCHGMVVHMKLQNSSIYSEPNVTNLQLVGGTRGPSRFVKTAAKKIKFDLFNQTATRYGSKGPFNLIVMHIRAGDKPCVLQKLNAKQLVDKIASFGVPQKNEIVYLMTNMPENSAHFKAIRKYFRNHPFFGATDIDMFKRKAFTKMGSYLVYAVEKRLQDIAERIIVTYSGYVTSSSKLVGVLAPSCGPKGRGMT
ncbi:uncharacterized protein LOC142351870 [Convolutriloba macropyga]|uniref:uncharacterized protein LOC142351870 n=1 Tax=Convolutriloba macropyga TaxID=536237 RepID=UPI003F52790A